jgi:hypothetical protein
VKDTIKFEVDQAERARATDVSSCSSISGLKRSAPLRRSSRHVRMDWPDTLARRDRSSASNRATQ